MKYKTECHHVWDAVKGKLNYGLKWQCAFLV